MWQENSSGVALLSSILFTFILYWFLWEKIKEQYLQVKATQNRWLTTSTKTIFWLSEIVATAGWMFLGVALLAHELEFYNEVFATLFFAFTLMFSFGQMTWPLFVNILTQDRKKEFFSIFIYTFGACGMAVVAVADQKIRKENITVVLLSAYMALHFLVFDAIGWTWILRQSDKTNLFSQTLEQNFIPMSSTFSAC